MHVDNLRRLKDDVQKLHHEGICEANLLEMQEKAKTGAFCLKADFVHSSIEIKQNIPVELVLFTLESQLNECRQRQIELLNRVEICAFREKEEICKGKESERSSKTSSELVSPSDTSPTKTTSKLASISTDVFTDITNGP